MSSSLKQELKAWEATFRSQHGRDPTKQDIKLVPEIARKYKDYNKTKRPSSSQPPQNHSGPAPTSIFRTPTKPRTSSRPNPTDSASRLESLHGLPSPTKRSVQSKDRDGDHSMRPPQYVLANSPTKLRDLAAMHSSTGSPNRPSGPNWLGATKSTATAPLPSTSTFEEVDRPRSNSFPRKALNPFASPRKEVGTVASTARGATLFDEFEKQERKRLKKKGKSDATEGGQKSKRLRQGMGWGHATDALDRRRGEADEVDEFFGTAVDKQKSRTSPFSHSSPAGMDPSASTTSKPSSLSPGIDADEDFLGPSPVKPSSSSMNAAHPARSFQRTLSSSSSTLPFNKPFKPLFVDPGSASTSHHARPPVLSSIPAVAADSKPKLFETSLRLNHPRGSTHSIESVGQLGGSTSHGDRGKSSEASKDPVDTLLDDEDDSFYADPLDAIERETEEDAVSGRRSKVAKRGRGTKGREQGRRIGKGKATETNDGQARGADSDVGDQDEDEVRLEKDGHGGFILDFRIQELADQAGEKRERIVIHQKGTSNGRRAGKSTGTGTSEQMQVDGNEENPDSDLDDLDDSLLLSEQTRTHALLSSRPRQARRPSPTPAASLPSDLASILSLRNSPRKKSSSSTFAQTGKDRQVAMLLGEPSARLQDRQRGGLLELSDEAEDLAAVDAGEPDDYDSDDDWDEAVDGWKEPGEAMDGYYSGGEEW